MDILTGVQGSSIILLMVLIILFIFALVGITGMRIEQINMTLCVRLPAVLISLLTIRGAYLAKENLNYGKLSVIIGIITLIILVIIDYKHR